MARRLLLFAGLIQAWCACGGTPSLAAPSAHPATPATPARGAAFSQARLDANELGLMVSNFGSLAYPPPISIIPEDPPPPPGLEWPRGSGRGVLYAAGLWIGAKVAGEPRVTVAEYGSEYAPGPMDGSGNAVDPGATDVAHRVYRIRRGDGPSNPDWAQWPIALGAPSDGAGNPRVIGDQTLWCVYNDAVGARHTLRPGGTAPLGLEIRQTVFGFDRPGPIGRIAFVQYEIYNRGGQDLEDAYVGLWADPDLGVAQDDLVGCDTTLSLGLVYNADDSDEGAYGSHPPALGVQILKGPRAGSVDLGMTSFGRLRKNWLEPETPEQSYDRFLGIREDGSTQACATWPASPLFEVPGDPAVDADWSPDAVEISCLDSEPADRRMLVATGPFDFSAGTSRRIVMAILVGGRPELGERLGNLERLRMTARIAREVYARDFENIGVAPDVDPGDRYFATVGVPVTLDGSRTVAGSGPAPAYLWDFGDGGGAGLRRDHIYTQGRIHKAVLSSVGGDFDAHCGVRVEVFDPGAIPVGLGDATTRGLVDVRHLEAPGGRLVFEGVPWGGRRFNRGVDTGCRWFGSSIAGESDDQPRCPSAAFTPALFRKVRLVYGPTQRAYRFFRRELPGGGEPAAGRGYTYQGFVDIPFRAFRELGNGALQQLDLLFTERQVTDDAGDPTGLAQPVSQDGIWFPTTEPDGGHEYFSIMAQPYTGNVDGTFAVDGAFVSGSLPVLYGGQVRKTFAGAIQPGEGLEFLWVDMTQSGPGFDAAWGTLGSGVPVTFLATGGGSSRAFERDRFSLEHEFKDYDLPLAAPAGDATSAAWGDFDGDGLDDLFVCGNAASALLHQALDSGAPYYRRYGFSLTPIPSFLAGPSRHAAWADVDLDGDLDLGTIDLGEQFHLWVNDGAAFMEAASLPPGVPAGSRIRWTDFDGDLDPDLCLAGPGGVHRLRNEGPGGWVELAPLTTLPARDAVWGDYDRDGDMDVFIIHAFDPNLLLRNDGSAGFTDVTTPVLEGARRSQRAAWTDYDADGDLDLGLVDPTGFYLLGNDEGAFSEAAHPLLPTSANAVAPADIDDDGDVDFHLVGAEADVLLRTEIPGARWLSVRLAGTRSQRQGIGATIRVTAGGRTQTRHVTAEEPPVLTPFGLGSALAADVEVHWPTGTVSRLAGVPLFSRVTIVEDFSPPPRLALGRVYPNPGRDVARVELLIPDGGGSVELRIYDLAGREVWSRRETGLLPGLRTVSWDGRDRDGRDTPAGVYFFRATHRTGGASARVVRLK